MKYKLTPIERSVGFFLLISFAGMFFVSVGILARNLFWQDKVSFNLKLTTSGQLQAGSKVQLKGMNIGKVTEVILSDDAEVIAKFEVGSEYHKFFTESSQVYIKNPMVIGEKIVELEYIPNPKLVKVGNFFPVKEGEDILSKMNAIEWKHITPILAHLEGTLKTTNAIAGTVEKQLPKTFAGTDKISIETQKAIKGMNSLIADLQETAPLLKTAAKDLPAASEKSVKAIHEAIIVLRSMQKSYFLKSGAEEVKKEIAKENEIKEPNRMPASVK